MTDIAGNRIVEPIDPNVWRYLRLTPRHAPHHRPTPIGRPHPRPGAHHVRGPLRQERNRDVMTEPTATPPIDLDVPQPREHTGPRWMPFATAVLAAALAAVIAAVAVSTLVRAGIRSDVAAGRPTAAPQLIGSKSAAPTPSGASHTFRFTPATASVQTNGSTVQISPGGEVQTDGTFFLVLVQGTDPTCTLTVDGDSKTGITHASGPGWTTCSWSP